MVLKRHYSEGGSDDSEFPGQDPKRRLAFASALRYVIDGPSLHEVVSRLEPFIKRVVQEEVEHAFHSSLRSSLNQTEAPRARACQLHFNGKLPSTLFTGSRIESEDGEPVKIIILDPSSKKIITSGPLSSLKIEVVVLPGDFVMDDEEGWNEEDFDSKIVREREGKRPLVTGDLVISLRDGVGYIGDICFTDNSSWIRSRKFKLGARVQNPQGRIREAISEAFVVKDQRGESYRKHHPPSLGDEIWRLERIAKDGASHKKLALHGISTVKDFLRLYVTDPSSLRSILGGLSNKTWHTIINHASACVLDGQDTYIYYGAVEKVGLLFNSIFKVVGVTFDGENYQPLDNELSLLQMRLVEDLKQRAYRNLNDIVPVDQLSVVGQPLLSAVPQDDPFNNLALGLQSINFPISEEDQVEMQPAPSQMTTLLPYTNEVEDSQVEFPSSHNYPMQVFSPSLSFVMRDSCYGPSRGGYSWAADASVGPVAVVGQTSMWEGNELFLEPSSQAVGLFSSDSGFHKLRKRKPKAGWCKIWAAIKWGISVRRDAAAKRMARLLCF